MSIWKVFFSMQACHYGSQLHILRKQLTFFILSGFVQL